ncbi:MULTISPECIES: bifunctional UDP-N-acetylglucosamine diphosphorylase/glucosamine-1-phosphate N-acetyltransferase GlmU [unclassified Campylobacter]|uniref:bifunctional UDP-N-acetylglucosamine diphosphorylase/glucosamine-1-phosphate N-acetyltransferase GlmU n=1 Tax=unclassified Campylobacter TaxID=2593542 RepID=UPI001237EB6E|nr:MULTISPECIES: bifunctional UDP-N-acetylglucosamine diphosphorylase/glucosamine-1-phosphate N-acetyltransferase GlmU [unclassified Campylobacter]KAA6225609.1 bifunctional UDP-N-acetylglucosamine diphosphorylase/glucosamine-1-phosphate N-acetyltransferase GlmU [Campylobacter sp. LR185c]KAA6227539.1 bifunctional UDP-N-acetylglucosamine diphosphorylase/glucosamine-1-phosphate N-acetyltransferase GlmU [Campylobacter sp. LR196d]KAA6228566.1 bifunctional UDP-N-acetylglucosamine diphosphorylase/gluco
MQNISIVILAAGLGTRMKSDVPKVLQKISDKSMIWHILDKANTLSNDISVILSHKKEEVEKEICLDFKDINFISQDLQNYPGTAGALKEYKAKHDKVLILCGDMPLIQKETLKNLINNDSDLSVAVFDTKDAKSYGRVIIKDNEIQKIVELKDANEEEKNIKICNSGVYVIKTSILNELLPKITNDNRVGEFYLTDIIRLSKEKNYNILPIFVDEYEFMGVNDKFELSVAENLMQERIKKNLMQAGVIMQNPASIFISAQAKFIKECKIEANVQILGKSIIENSIIKHSSVIEESVILNSDIGPLAHIRPGCEISNTHIGNFVECKKARLNGVKAGHLSYLGDCEIDEGTNIGCGTITCNYDGVKKYKTIIGKNVFIGSDTQLIAPIKIDDEVIIAAGSCVSQNIKSGTLFINRAKEKIVKDYFYKKFGKK